MEKPSRIAFSSFDSIELVKSGSKTLTYRYCPEESLYQNLEAGDKLEIYYNGAPFGSLKITSVSFLSFSKLPLVQTGHESYESREEMSQVFQEMYKRPEAFSPDDIFIIIAFEFLS